MRIPNKFNGYSADNRRLYYDPLTLAALTTAAGTTTAAAGTGAALTAAAAPALTTAATTAAVPLATTTAANLGTTAALEASKQGIIQAGAQQAGIEATKQAGIEAAKQATQEGVKQAAQEGIMQGAQNTAQTVTEQSIQNGLNNVNNLTANLNSGTMTDAGIQNVAPEILPQKAQTLNQLVDKVAQPQSPFELTSKTIPDIATKPVDQIASTSLPQSSLPSTNIADGANVAKDVVGNPNLKMPGMPELTTAKAPPSGLERGFNAATKFASDHPYITTGGIMLAQNMSQPSAPVKKKYSGSGGSGDFKYTEPSAGEYTPIFEPTAYAKEGGLMGYAVGGPVEQMSSQNALGSNTGYPMANLQTPMYTNPQMSRPMATNVVSPSADTGVDTYSGEIRMASGGYAKGGKLSAFERMMQEEKARQEAQAEEVQAQIEKGKSLNPASKPYSRTQSTNSPYAASIKEFQALSKKYGLPVAAPAKTNVDLMGDQDQIEYAANGGIMHGLGGYSDGGRLLKGPGDGVSDSIPAVIGRKQPARLADGEFVIPARIVSELGNGSTEAGARKLYAMMERVQKRRGKTVGKGKVAVNSKADKHLPA